MAGSCAEKESPVLSPEQAIRDFEIEAGFEVACAAHEPMVQDPVAIAFDDDGQMWVVEMRGYMPDANGLDETVPNGRIKILSDKDNDGTFEHQRIFLDSLVLPRAICPVYGGALVAEPPILWFYDKSGKSKVVVDSSYAEGGNVEHQANGLLLGIDNWIYSAKSEKRYRLKNGSWQKETTLFRGQWGIDQTDYGHLFYNHNSAVLLGDQWPPSVLPFSSAKLGNKVKAMFGMPMAENRVYPREPTPGVNRGYEPGILDSTGRLVHVTSACGISIYGGGQFDQKYEGNAFSPEPAAQLIKRIILVDNDDQIEGKLPYTDREFLRSGDERFRPVFTTTGPEGALYVVDMHRGLIQHSTYLTNYLRKYVSSKKLDSYTGMGRIFRIQAENRPSVKTIIGDKSGFELVKLLEHPNRWVRLRAQWKINSGQIEVYMPLIEKLYLQTKNEVTKFHILHILNDYANPSIHILKDAIQSKRMEIRHLAMQMMAKNDFDLLKKYRNKKNKLDEMAYISSIMQCTASDFEKVKPEILMLISAFESDSLLASIMAGGLWQYCPERHLNDLKKSISKASLLNTWLKKSPISTVGPDPGIVHLSALDRVLYREGERNYDNFCSGCHGKNGEGIEKIAPPLAGSEWVTTQDISVPVSILLHGKSGPIQVAGKMYNLPMPMPGLMDNQAINDGSIANILTYVRNSWGNKASAIHTEEVSRIRVSPAIKTNEKLIENNNLPTKIQTNQKHKTQAASTDINTPLFNGKDLKGWKVLGGKATYLIEKGTIIGSTTVNTPNTFLATERPYADFILELKIWIDTMLNSGIQIRSNSYKNYHNGVFHGYQIEVDPSSRAWSGGLYDESRRGWLYDLKDNHVAQTAFKKYDWNHYRIEAIGPRIRTFINGQIITDYIDSLTRSGYIGLQVHNIGNDSTKIGKKVKWRNLKISDLGGTIWTASEEDQKNLLYYAYDQNPSTHWKGRFLNLDLQKRQNISLTVQSMDDLSIDVSTDGVRWTHLQSAGDDIVLRQIRYIKIKGAADSDIRLNEVKLWFKSRS